MAARSFETTCGVPPGTFPHSNASIRYASTRFTATVALERPVALIGGISDAYDNAGVETVMGTYTDESIAKNSSCATAR